jgi:hypothetical protein
VALSDFFANSKVQIQVLEAPGQKAGALDFMDVLWPVTNFFRSPHLIHFRWVINLQRGRLLPMPLEAMEPELGWVMPRIPRKA